MQTSKTDFSNNDSDYTCPNFLQKLLGKTALTSQTNCSIRNIEQTFQYTPQRNFPSTFRTTKKAQTAKMLGERVARSKAQDIKTFSVFFKTILKQFKSSEEVDILWSGFEDVMHSQSQVYSYVNDLKINKKLQSTKKSEEIQSQMTQSSSKSSQQTSSKNNFNKRISKTPNKLLDSAKIYEKKHSHSLKKCGTFSKALLKKNNLAESRKIIVSFMRGDQEIKRH